MFIYLFIENSSLIQEVIELLTVLSSALKHLTALSNFVSKISATATFLEVSKRKVKPVFLLQKFNIVTKVFVGYIAGTSPSYLKFHNFNIITLGFHGGELIHVFI